MKKIQYIGCFFDYELIQKLAKAQRESRLFRTITSPHVTIWYHPKTVPYDMLCSSITVECIGYGCDSENEAFEVNFKDYPEALHTLLEKVETPHITLSVSKNGKPVNSNKLVFQSITPFTIQGVFGAMGNDGFVHTDKQSLCD